jgi:hypothetical protein
MSVINIREPVVLEPASQGLVEATVGPPFLRETTGTQLSEEILEAVRESLRHAPTLEENA